MNPIKGFTIIELVVTVAILAIIASIAIPNFQRQIATNQLNTTVRELSDVFVKARGQALALHRDVTIRLSFDCPVPEDAPEDAPGICPPDTPILFHWAPTNSKISLEGVVDDVVYTAMGVARNQNTTSIPNPNYDPDADSDPTANPPVNPQTLEVLAPFEFTLCSSTLNESRVLYVTATGSIDRIERGAC